MPKKQRPVIDHADDLFPSKYLRWYHLQGSPALVRIEKVMRDVELTMKGGATEKKPVLELSLVEGLVDPIRPLVMNVTNKDSIKLIHGVKVSEWPGKEIVLYQSETRLGGKLVPCLRIRAKKESAK